MPTQCSQDLFGFAPVVGRRVEGLSTVATPLLRPGPCFLEQPIGRSESPSSLDTAQPAGHPLACAGA